MDHCDIHILITLDSRLSNCDVTSDEFEEVEAEINNIERDEKLPLFITYWVNVDIFLTFILINFLVRMLKCFILFFCHKKLKKPPSKVAQKY